MITSTAFFLVLALLVLVLSAMVLNYFEHNRAVAATKTGAVINSLASASLVLGGLGSLLAIGLMLRNAPVFLA